MLCPFCKEEVQDDALKCKHCKSMIGTATTFDHEPVEKQETGYVNDPYESRHKGRAEITSDDRLWGCLVHLSGFVGFGIIAPLILYFVKKDESPFIAHHAKQALLFQIMLIVCSILSILLAFILIGFILFPILMIIGIVFPIFAAVAANKGEYYNYPLL